MISRDGNKGGPLYFIEDSKTKKIPKNEITINLKQDFKANSHDIIGRDRHLQLADEMIRKLNEELKQQKSVNKHGLAENANLRVQLAVSHTQHPIRFEYFFRIVSEHVNR